MSISNRIKSVTTQDITYRKITILNKEFDNTLIIYNQTGLQTQTIHEDTEFKPTEDTIKEIYITVSYTTEQEHVPEIERTIISGT